jgi:hypothetical protein
MASHSGAWWFPKAHRFMRSVFAVISLSMLISELTAFSSRQTLRARLEGRMGVSRLDSHNQAITRYRCTRSTPFPAPS